MKIVVIGAGLSGCVCAWRLAQEGHSVTLLEKGRGVGGGWLPEEWKVRESITGLNFLPCEIQE